MDVNYCCSLIPLVRGERISICIPRGIKDLVFGILGPNDVVLIFFFFLFLIKAFFEEKVLAFLLLSHIGNSGRSNKQGYPYTSPQ